MVLVSPESWEQLEQAPNDHLVSESRRRTVSGPSEVQDLDIRRKFSAM